MQQEGKLYSMPRPRKQIDEEMLRQLASLGLTSDECAVVLGCSKDTIERRYMPALLDGRHKRNASLRRKQFEIAMSGNATMLIWLGKQCLGQMDRTEHTGASGGPITIANLTAADLSDEQLAAIIQTDKSADKA